MVPRVPTIVLCCALCWPWVAATARGDDATSTSVPSTRNAGRPDAPSFPVLRSLIRGPSAAIEPGEQPALSGTEAPAGAAQSGVATLMQVRLSHAFLSNFVERDINRSSQVQETILGTSVSGSAATQGTSAVVLHEDDDQAVVEVVLRGTVQANTIGQNGPVQLHCSSQTPFVSRKLIHMTDSGIRAFPAESEAHTRSTTHSIRSTLPGLRGRLAERIAWNRSRELRSQADAIASRNAERRLNAAFDLTIERSLAAARGTVKDELTKLPVGDLPGNWHYRSQPGFIEMTLYDPDHETRGEPAPGWEPEADVAMRIHRTALREALLDGDLQRAVTPLMSRAISAGQDDQHRGTPATQVSTGASRPIAISWSEDGQWLEIELNQVGADPE